MKTRSSFITFATMEVYHLVLYCVLATTAVSLSIPDGIATNANGNLVLDSQSRNCNCENGRCVTDNQGHSKCVCQPGFALQDEFTCKPCDCGSLGKCIFTLKVIEGDKYEYQKKCVCDVGRAEKDGVCVDCFCGENSACDFDFGERRCYCIEGYSEKDGVCTKCDCGFYGQCEYIDGNKKCECDEGYLELNGICEECDCGEQGTCSFVDGQATCKCEEGFSVNNGKCEPCDCGSNSESCVFVGGVKQCKCKDKYADRYGTCEECYCGDYTTSCSFNENQKTCSCLEGYVQKGETCELGCSVKNPCQHGGYCKGGFCFCLNGTRGEFCEVIDECTNLCPKENDITCAYDVSSQKAYCKCLDDSLRYNPGMKQCRKTCSIEKSCANGGICELSDRDYFCKCPEGLAGDFCEVVPACDSMHCGTEAQCKYSVIESKAVCACSNDLAFDVRDKKCKKTCNLLESCKNGGICEQSDTALLCKCPEGTTGDFCEVVPACDSMDCGTEAQCKYSVIESKAVCACSNDLSFDVRDKKCKNTCTSKDKEPCKNGGNCEQSGIAEFCKCPEGTLGDFCEEVPACETMDCGTEAQCQYSAKQGKAACSCSGDLSFDATDKKCKRTCTGEKSCKNGGSCHQSDSSFFCKCPEGTAGDFCEEIPACDRLDCGTGAQCKYNIKERKATCVCSNNLSYDPSDKKCKNRCTIEKSCKNGGSCQRSDYGFFCKCPEGIAGDFCEEILSCRSMDCGTEAECKYKNGIAACVCSKNLHFDEREKKCKRTCSRDSECLNGGKCHRGLKNICKCLPGTRGDRCEVVDNCPNCRGDNAYCSFDLKHLNATCKCKDKKLEYDFLVRKCIWSCDEDKDCLNGGKCRYRGEHKFCTCLSGTQGPRCQIVDDCYSGLVRCRGSNAQCVFDVKKLKAVCKCQERNHVYDSRNGRCRRNHSHH